MIGFLKHNEREQLKVLYKTAKNVRISRKAHIILLLDKGLSYGEVAKLLFIDELTVRRNEAAYKEDGLSSITTIKFKGSIGFLSESQREELKEHLSTNIYSTSKAVCVYVQKKYLVSYTSRGMVKLLNNLGFVYKKPQLVPGKADPEAQRAFVEKYENLKNSLGPKDKIFSMDGVHPHHNSKPAYGWILKGKTAYLKSNTGRQRININGAISTNGLDGVFKSYDTINAVSVVDFLGELEKQNTDAKIIYVIADNAKYYRAKIVTEFLKNSKIEILFLPPYSPNLNVIERLWKFFHEKVTNNKYYEKFKDFNNATMGFFENIDQYKEELSVRLRDRFQIINSDKDVASAPDLFS